MHESENDRIRRSSLQFARFFFCLSTFEQQGNAYLRKMLNQIVFILHFDQSIQRIKTKGQK